MSIFGEQDPIDPDDPELDYAPIRLSERAAKLGPSVSQAAMSGAIRSFPISRPGSLAPKATGKPAGRMRDLDQRAALFSVAARVAAIAVVVASVALLLVIMRLASRQSIADATPSDITESTSLAAPESVVAGSGLSEITGSMSTAPPQSAQADVGSKPTLEEFRALLASPPSQPATHEHSQQLLQNFLQWRKKANTTETSQ